MGLSPADYKPETNAESHAKQLLRSCKACEKHRMIFINIPHDIRLINEQTLMALLVYANPKLKNPKWSIASFMIILVQIISKA